jgi:hypothetical protein
MKKILFRSVLLTLLILSACNNDEASKSFTLSELEKNKANSLRLLVEEKIDLKALCKELAEADISGIEKRVQKKNAGLLEVSYGFYFLGSKYLEKNDFDKGLQYLHIAADHYLNPLAMHTLSVIYSKPAEMIKKGLNSSQASQFRQNFEKSYYYLHRALNSAILTMEKYNDRTIVDDVNKYALPLIEIFEKKDSTVLRNFDFQSAEARAKKDLSAIKSEFEGMYGGE